MRWPHKEGWWIALTQFHVVWQETDGCWDTVHAWQPFCWRHRRFPEQPRVFENIVLEILGLKEIHRKCRNSHRFKAMLSLRLSLWLPVWNHWRFSLTLLQFYSTQSGRKMESVLYRKQSQNGGYLYKWRGRKMEGVFFSPSFFLHYLRLPEMVVNWRVCCSILHSCCIVYSVQMKWSNKMEVTTYRRWSQNGGWHV